MELRTKNSYSTFIYDFLKFDILVVCPFCTKKSIIKTNNFSLRQKEESDIKVICTNCGFNKQLSDIYSKENKLISRLYIIGTSIDPFFHLPLWLTKDLEENTLWAYNYEHLNFLREHIEAKLRERNGKELTNKSLGSRLPKWMTSKKNREKVLKRILELQEK